MNFTDIAELVGVFFTCWAIGAMTGIKLQSVIAFFRGAGDI
jgi:hypothetical protein